MSQLKDAERHVLKGAMELLHHSGFLAIRINSGTIRTPGGHYIHLAPKGTSDVMAVIPRSGRVMAVETKKERGGVLSDDQAEFLAKIREAGGVAVVIHDLRRLERIIGLLKSDPWAIFDQEGIPCL